jgi:hypothetical protein
MSRLNTIARRLAFGALVSACSFGVFAKTSPITDEQKKNDVSINSKSPEK